MPSEDEISLHSLKRRQNMDQKVDDAFKETRVDDEFKDTEDEVVRIAGQVEEAYRNKEEQWDLYFYRVVLAGNVKIIQKVVSHMENKDKSQSVQALDWLLQRDKHESSILKKTSKSLKIRRIAVIILLSLVNVVLTPVFYALQMFMASFVKRRQRHISDNVQLPLAFAVFSMKKEMIELFLSLGVEIDQIDANGNTVFHYIADLSSVAPEAASEMFQLMMQIMTDREDARTLLQQTRNSAGLTAVEYTATFGSPSLLTLILMQPNIMHHTPFAASTDQVTFNDEANRKIPDEARTRTETLDVTMYEAGTMDQSTLLNVLSDRDIAGMSIKDLHIFNDREFIGKWLKHKSKQRLGGIMLFHFVEFALTIMLLYILSQSFIGQYGVANQKWKFEEDIKVQAAELDALSRNTSSILTDAAFYNLTAWKRLQQQQRWWNKTWHEDPEKVLGLLNATSLDPIISVVPNAPMKKWNASFENLTDQQMDTLYEQTKIMPEFENDTLHIRIVRLYPEIVQKLSKELMSKKARLFSKLDTVFTDKEKVAQVYGNLKLKDEGGEIIPSLSLPHYDLNLAEMICADLRRLDRTDFRDVVADYTTLTLEDLDELINDACYYQLFMNVVAKGHSCKGENHHELFRMMFGSPEEMYIMPLIVLICMYLYIFLDIIERCVYLIKSIKNQTNTVDMVMTIIIHKIPGPYIRKQLNIIACMVVIFQFHFSQYFKWVQHSRTLTNEERLHYDGYAATMVIVAIVVRFVMHIHSLRLLPSIGNFIITMFMMGTNLLHFSAVYCIIVLLFSVLFYILIDDPNCPLEKSVGFETYAGSVFSTFRLTFAHGDLTPFFSSIPVQIAYVLYVIIVVLLLLNLIIAIMSTTATGIMTDPWRKVLWKIEWLDEVTSLDYSLTILLLPFRKLRPHRYRYKSHKQAGFLVRRVSKFQYRVYIECFRYPALKEVYDRTE